MIGDAATSAAYGASGAIGPLIVSLGLDAFGSHTAVLKALGAAAVALAVETLLVSPPDGFAPAGNR